MQGIVWLASYPKSGNTWFRALLANYFWAKEEAVSINRLGGGPMASARFLFDQQIGVAASDLNYNEVRKLRPQMYSRLANGGLNFMKVHDSYLFSPSGEPFFPPEVTYRTFYLVRNPLDVAVSYSKHNDCTLAESVKSMKNPRHQLSPRVGGLPAQLPQLLGTWSNHVQSWVDAKAMDVMVIRYEDLKADTESVFSKALLHLDIEPDPTRLRNAVKYSSFQSLREQEESEGFLEKPRRAKSFFRKGQVGGWREVFSKELWDDIVESHSEVMERFGYLQASQWRVPS